MKKPNVVQEDGKEVPVVILAASIKAIADGYQKMKKSGLNERAIVLLLHDASGVGKPAIKCVLTALNDLERLFLSKKEKS